MVEGSGDDKAKKMMTIKPKALVLTNSQWYSKKKSDRDSTTNC